MAGPFPGQPFPVHGGKGPPNPSQMPLPFNQNKGKPMKAGGKAHAAATTPPQATAQPSQPQEQQQPQQQQEPPWHWEQPDPNYGWYGWSGGTYMSYDPTWWEHGPSSWNECSYGYATYDSPKKKKKVNPYEAAAKEGYYAGPCAFWNHPVNAVSNVI